jgi:hypothetical protein
MVKKMVDINILKYYFKYAKMIFCPKIFANIFYFKNFSKNLKTLENRGF